MPVLPKNEQVLDIYKHNRKTLFNCCFYLFFYLLLSIFLCLLVLSKIHNNYSALCQKVWEHFHEAWNKVIHSAMWHALLRSIHTWPPRNGPIFSPPLPHPICPPASKILPLLWSFTPNFKQISRLQMIANQLKENITEEWLLYVIRSFLQVGFPFQSQLLNLAWLSIGFFPFSWSQNRNHNNFEKLKTSFSSSFYGEKMSWGQCWAEDSQSGFSQLYIFVCAVVQKYREMFFVYNYSHF